MADPASLSLGTDDLDVIDAVLAQLADRKVRMETANCLLERWGPVSAAPGLLQLGFRQEQIQAITTGQGPAGFSTLDFARVEKSLERLRAFRDQVASGAASNIPIEQGGISGEDRSFAPGDARKRLA